MSHIAEKCISDLKSCYAVISILKKLGRLGPVNQLGQHEMKVSRSVYKKVLLERDQDSNHLSVSYTGFQVHDDPRVVLLVE